MPIQQHNSRYFLFSEPVASVVRLILLGLAINITGCRPGNAQTTAPPKRLGILMGGSSCPGPGGPTFWKPLLQNLAGRGWIEGRTLIIDCISADGRIEQAPMLARETAIRGTVFSFYRNAGCGISQTETVCQAPLLDLR
jgi:hypothetical protein